MKPTNINTQSAAARQLQAHIIDRRTIAVASTTTPSANHIVTLDYDSEGTIRAHCTCPWALNGGIACSHVLAALDALAARRGRALAWNSRAEAQRQKHRTFHLLGSTSSDEDGLWITSRSAA